MRETCNHHAPPRVTHDRFAYLAAALAGLGLAGCMVQPAPRPTPVTVQNVPRRLAPVPDWFQSRLATARAARRAHLPRSDTVGARQAYFQLALAACAHIDAHGLSKYRTRCNALLQKSVAAMPPPREDNLCDEGSDDPDKVTACND